MGLLPSLKGIFTGGASVLVEKVGNALDNVLTSKEEKEAAKLAIEQEVNRHMEILENNAKEIELAYLRDSENARNREIQIATSDKAPLLNKIITPVLAIGILILTFGMYYGILFHGLGKDNKEIVFTILGVLSTLSANVAGYYFGSSSGSKAKQEQLDKQR